MIAFPGTILRSTGPAAVAAGDSRSSHMESLASQRQAKPCPGTAGAATPWLDARVSRRAWLLSRRETTQLTIAFAVFVISLVLMVTSARAVGAAAAVSGAWIVWLVGSQIHRSMRTDRTGRLPD